jgi:Zn-dependent protease with chaperone function
MQPVNGFFGHIQKNHFRSLYMFMGFMLSMHITVATVMSIPPPVWSHIPAVFSDPIAYFKTVGLLVTAVNFVIFVLFYYGQNFLLKLTIGFEPLTVNHCPRIHNITQELSTLAGIPMPRLDYVPSPALNSFASGISKSQAHIIVTQGLLDALDDEELAAVIAHEIAHIKNGDMHMMAVANAAIGSINSINFINPMKMTLFKHIPIPVFLIGFPIFFPLFLLVVFYSFIMQLTSLITTSTSYVISSSREFIADAEAVGLTHNPAALVSALSKIHGRSRLDCKNIIASSMMIDGPTTGKHASHPPMQTRIQKLAELSGSMIHGSGVRKDTRRRSLKNNNGNAYGAPSFTDGNIAPSFAQGFSRHTHASPVNVGHYISTSADYAEHTGKTFKTEDSASLLDRLTQGNDAEFGLDRAARWFMIAALGIYVASILPDYLNKRAKEAAFDIHQHVELVPERTPAFIKFDLKNDGLVTIGQDQSKVFLNIHNDGKAHKIGWVGPGEGLLFFDDNQNGFMDGLHELVSLTYPLALQAKKFHMLKKFDNNKDHRITHLDEDFSKLMIWRDLNIDGKYTRDEGDSLDQLGITSILLRARKLGGREALLTQNNNTQLIKKGAYTHDANRALKPVGDMAGGNIYMTSFEVSLTNYRVTEDQLSVEIISENSERQSAAVLNRRTSISEPPALRLRR